MRWIFDLDAAAFYFTLTGDAPASQRELARGVIVDLDERGAVAGVEVLQGADIGAGLADLVDLVGRVVASSIVFVLTHPPLPRGGSAQLSRPAVSSPPAQSGAQSYELLTV